MRQDQADERLTFYTVTSRGILTGVDVILEYLGYQ